MGRIICAGLGPGDPDLISVRADRAVRAARHVAYFATRPPRSGAGASSGHAAADAVDIRWNTRSRPRSPSIIPTYNDALAGFYDLWAARLAQLAQTDDVVVLCEGDPFLYGSFMHLQVRLQGLAEVEVIPAFPGMVGCWNAVGQPMTWGDDVLTVLMGTLPRRT